jgi:hypothetical protein
VARIAGLAAVAHSGSDPIVFLAVAGGLSSAAGWAAVVGLGWAGVAGLDLVEAGAGAAGLDLVEAGAGAGAEDLGLAVAVGWDRGEAVAVAVAVGLLVVAAVGSGPPGAAPLQLMMMPPQEEAAGATAEEESKTWDASPWLQTALWLHERTVHLPSPPGEQVKPARQSRVVRRRRL